jgi:hypothetical protein
VILVIWLVLVMAVSISPLSFKLRLHTTGIFHVIGHYVVYTLTGILLWMVAGRWFGRVSMFCVGLAMAFGQEWIENWIYHAGFEWRDVRTDLAGLVSGYLVMVVILVMRGDSQQRG